MLPIVSNGERETVETRALSGIGGPITEVAEAPRVRATAAIESTREAGFEALREIPIRDLLDRIADAGRRFEDVGARDGLPPYATYRERVARSTGLPVGWVDVSAHWLGYGLRHAAETLRAQSPTGGLDLYDDPAYTRETTVGLAFTPRVRTLGAVMPGNDPTVYGWPALALAMKVPVVLRPSDRDPFTAVRLARALIAAGIPESAVHVLPGPRDVGETIVREADHAMVFGGDEAVGAYRDDPSVETYGPGRSVAVVGREPTDRELATLARGITRSAGRACFCLTRIVALADCDADALADGLARRVAGTTDGPVTDDSGDVPSFQDTDRARRIHERVDDLGVDVTAAYRDGPRLHDGDDHARLAPTVLRAEEFVPEFPFPLAGVTGAQSSDPRDLIDALDGAYLAVATGAESVERAMVRSPHVRKVYAGTYPAAVDLRETHETFLADFLYATSTYDPE